MAGILAGIGLFAIGLIVGFFAACVGRWYGERDAIRTGAIDLCGEIYKIEPMEDYNDRSFDALRKLMEEKEL